MLLLFINCVLLLLIFFQCNLVKEGNISEDDDKIRILDMSSRVKMNEHRLTRIGQVIDDMNRHIEK